MLDEQFRLGRPTHASRSLHTFVPLPSASNPPTMVSHGGIPSHMIVNPEPNLRPLTIARYPREEEDYLTTVQVQIPHPEIRHPAKGIPQFYLREQQRVRIFLELLPASRCRFLFGQKKNNNGPLRLKTHNQRNYFTSCDPHHDIYTFSYWQIFWHSI